MRMSCNGCRVLRKGCSEDCTIRPCLQWIKNPEAQANATVFLAKFYGRAGLVNLINAGPDNLRPAIFRSLLYEACGRIVNPIYGSVGLLWSGSWHLCQAAVEAVLKGRSPVAQASAEAAAAAPGVSAALKPYDIRHVAKRSEGGGDAAPGDLHVLAAKSRARFKRSGVSAAVAAAAAAAVSVAKFQRAGSSHSEGESRENGSALSAETAEGSHVSQGEPEAEANEGLDLRLGLGLGDDRGSCAPAVERSAQGKRSDVEADACHVRLGLGLAP